MTDPINPLKGSDRSDHYEILELFRSDRAATRSDRSDQSRRMRNAGPTGPTVIAHGPTQKVQQKQPGPTGPTGLEKEIGFTSDPQAICPANEVLEKLEVVKAAYDERAGIVEFDGQLPRVTAEKVAFQSAIEACKREFPLPRLPGEDLSTWDERRTAGAIALLATFGIQRKLVTESGGHE